MKPQRSAYETVAHRGAEYVLETQAVRFAPARMSKYAHWFEDRDRSTLIAVVTPGEKPTVIDEVLAYGLAWQHNRDLLLLVPDNMVIEAISRIGWIETEVRVFFFSGEDGIDPQPVRSAGRYEILERLAELPFRIPKQGVLKDAHESWLAGVNTAGLTSHDRGGYLSWHHEGLQVLQVSETKKGLRIRAGVQYKNSPPGREVFDKTFATAPTPCELAVVNAKVALAVEDGGSLSSDMGEHKMQANLISQPEALGLTHLWREFPAWRGLTTSAYAPAGRPGFIDFLGVDDAGVLHVIETKIGHDPKVVLQALDYAIWVRANDAAIREHLKLQGHVFPTPTLDISNASTSAPIHLVLGAAESGPAFNAYLAGQIEALAGDCKVHIYVTAQPTASPIVLTKVPIPDMWEPVPLIARPVVGPRWPGQLTSDLSEGNA